MEVLENDKEPPPSKTPDFLLQSVTINPQVSMKPIEVGTRKKGNSLP